MEARTTAETRSAQRIRRVFPAAPGTAGARPADDGPAEPIPGAAAADTSVVGRAVGLGRIAVSAGGWREDTVHVKVGTDPVAFADDLLTANCPVAYGLRVTGTLPAAGAPPAAPTSPLSPLASLQLQIQLQLQNGTARYVICSRSHAVNFGIPSSMGVLGSYPSSRPAFFTSA
jgi:hypothetical protein